MKKKLGKLKVCRKLQNWKLQVQSFLISEKYIKYAIVLHSYVRSLHVTSEIAIQEELKSRVRGVVHRILQVPVESTAKTTFRFPKLLQINSFRYIVDWVIEYSKVERGFERISMSFWRLEFVSGIRSFYHTNW